MVLIVSQTWYPASESEKAGKTYLELLKKYPEDHSITKPILRAALKVTKEGIHAISVGAVQEGKFKEAMDMAVNAMLFNSERIEGIKTTIDVYYDLVEAMPFVGLAAPQQ
ncbi:MAG: hypothetical protein ACFFE4_17405 [Candidatus Thorarchaeota archaeon]